MSPRDDIEIFVHKADTCSGSNSEQGGLENNFFSPVPTAKKCFMMTGTYRIILTWFRGSNLYFPHTLVKTKPINYHKSESFDTW